MLNAHAPKNMASKYEAKLTSMMFSQKFKEQLVKNLKDMLSQLHVGCMRQVCQPHLSSGSTTHGVITVTMFPGSQAGGL